MSGRRTPELHSQPCLSRAYRYYELSVDCDLLFRSASSAGRETIFWHALVCTTPCVESYLATIFVRSRVVRSQHFRNRHECYSLT